MKYSEIKATIRLLKSFGYKREHPKTGYEKRWHGGDCHCMRVITPYEIFTGKINSETLQLFEKMASETLEELYNQLKRGNLHDNYR